MHVYACMYGNTKIYVRSSYRYTRANIHSYIHTYITGMHKSKPIPTKAMAIGSGLRYRNMLKSLKNDPDGLDFDMERCKCVEESALLDSESEFEESCDSLIFNLEL
jgi:hypothetical protein